ncbi:hypothetical protein [Pedobacter psychrodurus]|uniref:hypothetical protein n=1 Tax=Pedobacter psychrodurus TaxID=2530456 RepID=UPI002930B36A|nr:hypothetical protein [Pedobacter psychrodurus]
MMINLGGLHAQTAGAGEVRSIELKSSLYEKNRSHISLLRSELPALEAAWRIKVQKAKDDLAALYKERDDLIADMKVGAKCSQCGKYKSEFEKEGKSFTQHLGEVKGYAIPATTTELETTRKLFTEKIAIKKVFLQNLEKGDGNVLKKQRDITWLENSNGILCREITQHSRDYERITFSEATAKQDDWISALTRYATDILIADDRITIHKARVLRYQEMFRKEGIVIRERVLKTNLEAQDLKNARILSIKKQIIDIGIEKTGKLSDYRSLLAKTGTEKSDIEEKLKNASIPDSTKLLLTAGLKKILQDIVGVEKSIAAYQKDISGRILSLENETVRLNAEIVGLRAGLSQQQNLEVAKVQPVYEQKKLDAGRMVSSSALELAAARKLYLEKAALYKKENLSYLELVVMESNRMVAASQKISCPVYNDTRFRVMGNWNKLFPCVNALTTMAKPYSYNVFNSYCPGKSAASQLSYYRSFLEGLDDDDKKAVSGNSNVNWFEKTVP